MLGATTGAGASINGVFPTLSDGGGTGNSCGVDVGDGVAEAGTAAYDHYPHHNHHHHPQQQQQQHGVNFEASAVYGGSNVHAQMKANLTTLGMTGDGLGCGGGGGSEEMHGGSLGRSGGGGGQHGDGGVLRHGSDEFMTKPKKVN